MGKFHLVLRIERFLFSNLSTIGVLKFGDFRLGYTLEPSAQSGKLIKDGLYTASIGPTPSWSRFYGDSRYKYQIRLEDKNGRKGILVHIGNFPKDTEGCILVGHTYGGDCLYRSSMCYRSLISFLFGFFRLVSFGKSDTFEFFIRIVNK